MLPSNLKRCALQNSFQLGLAALRRAPAGEPDMHARGVLARARSNNMLEHGRRKVAAAGYEASSVRLVQVFVARLHSLLSCGAGSLSCWPVAAQACARRRVAQTERGGTLQRDEGASVTRVTRNRETPRTCARRCRRASSSMPQPWPCELLARRAPRCSPVARTRARASTRSARRHGLKSGAWARASTCLHLCTVPSATFPTDSRHSRASPGLASPAALPMLPYVARSTPLCSARRADVSRAGAGQGGRAGAGSRVGARS